MPHAEIQKIYSEFRQHFSAQNYPSLFREFKRMESEFPSRYPHKLGHYAIFYTPIPEHQIDCMLIGNNPSWFESRARQSTDAAISADQKVRDLEKSAPDKNLYLTQDFTFGVQLQDIFVNFPQTLENIVGLNRFWVQTGPDFIQFRKDLGTSKAKKEFLAIQKICENYTRKIVEILKPTTVFLFGEKAQKAFKNCSLQCDFVNVRHPSMGGLMQSKTEVELYLKSRR